MAKWKDDVRRYGKGRGEFALADIYAADLGGEAHPDNHHVNEKLRQALQELERSKEFVRVRNGVYRMAESTKRSRYVPRKAASGLEYWVRVEEHDTPESLASYIEAHPSFEQPALNTSRTLKASTARVTRPKKDGLTPAEEKALIDIRKKYPNAKTHRIIKAGGTPDWHVQEWRDVLGTMGWVTVYMEETKTFRTSLARRTQEDIMVGLFNAAALKLFIPVTVSNYEKRFA